jgi:hypothetical protein
MHAEGGPPVLIPLVTRLVRQMLGGAMAVARVRL